MNPLIGISAGREIGNEQFSKINVPEHYIKAILDAGGTPLILPPGLKSHQIKTLIKKIDGVLITGGGDIDPQYYQGLPHPKISGVDPQRDELEITLVLVADLAKKPCFGICRGHQIINVAFGGSLYTDITCQLPQASRHDWFPHIARDYTPHNITIDPQEKLKDYLGGLEVSVNSLHHQAIQDLAPDLVITALAPDGVIESVEKPDHPFLIGVQWHPEWMVGSPAMKNLFDCFVEACL